MDVMARRVGYLLCDSGRARVGVILTPLRPFPETWDDRRMYVSA